MAYKDILVVLDDAAECGARVDVAPGLAQRHEAHLIGLMVIEPAHIPTYAMSQFPPEVLQARRRMEDEARSRVRGKFERQAGAAGVPYEWHTTEDDTVKAVSVFSRHADLTVIGQENPDRGAFGASPDLAENVALASGRPILIVPYVGTYPNAGKPRGGARGGRCPAGAPGRGVRGDAVGEPRLRRQAGPARRPPRRRHRPAPTSPGTSPATASTWRCTGSRPGTCPSPTCFSIESRTNPSTCW